MTLRLTIIRMIILCSFLALSACSENTDPADIELDEANKQTPAIADIIPKSYRKVWAPWKGDFEGMVERRMIRVVAPYGGYMYYFEDGEPLGAVWELTQHLELSLNEELGRRNIRIFVIVIPLSRDRLIPALLNGHADLIAADLTTTKMRSNEVEFTRPLLKNVNEVIVTGNLSDEINSLTDLSGREIHVRQSSSYYEHLIKFTENMQAKNLKPPKIVAVDEMLESEDILDMINAGMIDITVLDDYKANFWANVFPEIEVRNDLVINKGGTIAWAVRKDSQKFLEHINKFLEEYGRGTLIGNDTYNRYLDDANDVRCSRRIDSWGRLQKLASIFQYYGEMYELNWLKLAAQGFQESKLRQNRKSHAGAIGIMQIKPSTAHDPNIAIDNIADTDNNIHAGTKYMRFLMDRYFSGNSTNELDQWLLGLAAYNAGPARLISLREEAKDKGYNPNIWFDNVEIIAARRIGKETVTYVSNIFKYYTSYKMAFAKLDESERRFGNILGSCTI